MARPGSINPDRPQPMRSTSSSDSGVLIFGSWKSSTQWMTPTLYQALEVHDSPPSVAGRIDGIHLPGKQQGR
jgi:hypothetical protein